MKYRGKNLAISTNTRIAIAEASQPVTSDICFFISHIHIDKKIAQAIGNYIQDSGFNIFLDIYDDNLQTAVDNFDDDGITTSIDNGLSNSSHLICLVSSETKASWWVPYEIGYGKKGGAKVIAMKLYGNFTLPSYLSVATQINSISNLNIYLEKLLKRNKIYEVYGTYESDGFVKKASTNHPLHRILDN